MFLLCCKLQVTLRRRIKESQSRRIWTWKRGPACLMVCLNQRY